MLDRSHQMLDRRSLALQKLIGEKLRREPQLFAKVHANLAHWRNVIDVRSMPYIDAWQSLANQGIEACLSMSTADTEEAAAMRQCAPFCGVLTNKERASFFRAWSEEKNGENPS